MHSAKDIFLIWQIWEVWAILGWLTKKKGGGYCLFFNIKMLVKVYMNI